MEYTAGDYTTNHPLLSAQLAAWQIKPYPNDSDPRPTQVHDAMQSNFDTPDELADYIGLVLADVPHADIVAELGQGTARRVYMRSGYTVDVPGLITALDTSFAGRPTAVAQWRLLVSHVLRAFRHFASEGLGEMPDALPFFNKAGEYAADVSMLVGRHTHHTGPNEPRAAVYRARALMDVYESLKLGVSAQYLDRMAAASIPARGHTLRYTAYTRDWERAGIPPEYVGAVSAPLESAYGLAELSEIVVCLYRHGVAANYVAACASQGVELPAILRAWDSGVSAEYASTL